MATSPIYNWPEPDNTDLVKNGALAMRTLGDAIDTTMATMVPQTIVDAKGDLIAGTAADTAARLAVGTNGQVLTADSTTATGLAWATVSAGSATSYTPTWTNLTVGNATQAFTYIQIGKFVFVKGYLIFGSTTSVSGLISMSLPVTSVDYVSPNTLGLVRILDAGTASFQGYIGISAGATTSVGINVYKTDYVTAGGVQTASNALISSTSPITWTTNDSISVQFSYEAA